MGSCESEDSLFKLSGCLSLRWLQGRWNVRTFCGDTLGYQMPWITIKVLWAHLIRLMEWLCPPITNCSRFTILWQLMWIYLRKLCFATVAVWTKKNFFPLLTHPQESQGCQKITIFFSKMKLFSFCAKIARKRHKLQKPSKLKKKCQEKPCFLRHFWIFFNLGAILARQTSTCMFSGSWRKFWHHWDLWGRVNSGDTRVLRFVFIILWRWRHLADFSLLSKCCPMSAL